MSLGKKITLIVLIIAFGAGTWAAIYARKQGFTASWRGLIEQEFDKRGYYVDIKKLTLGPLRGLMAEEVRFYLDPAKRREIAKIDRMLLDLDFSKILNRKLSINTLDVTDARLSLPLDPQKGKKSRKINIEGLSARVIVTESQIELVKAEAELAGLPIFLAGNLTRRLDFEIDGDEEAKTEEEEKAEQKRQMDSLKARRSSIESILSEVDKLEFVTAERPDVEINFSGDLDNLAAMTAEIRLSGREFKFGNYLCKKLNAAIDYEGEKGRATLRELHIVDGLGDLRLQADWQRGRDELPFSLDSSADISTLAQAFFPELSLGEVAFYQSPRIKLEGNLLLNRSEEAKGLPMKAVGEFICDRFASRGAVFDGMRCDFSLAPEKVYVRNLRLDHKSGVAWLNAINTVEGFQYQAEVKMDPRVFSPFFAEDGTRKFLSRWHFDDQSTVYVELEGQGPSLDARSWHSVGKLDLRNCRFNDVSFQRLEADLDFNGPDQTYENVKITRPEGTATSPKLFFDTKAKKWRIDNLLWNLHHIEATRAINPKLSNHLAEYGFSAPPEIIFDGVVDGRTDEEIEESGELRSHNFVVNFSSDQPANYEFLGKKLPLANPEGTLHITGDEFYLRDFNAQLFSGDLSVKFKIGTAGDVKDDFAANVQLTRVPFEQVSELYSDYKSTSGAITGTASIYGTLGDISSVDGTGKAKIEDGDVFAIPLLGPLSGVAKGVLPNTRAGYSVAKEATANFVMEDGVLMTEDLQALANAFRFSGKGAIDCGTGEIDFEASFNTKFGLTAALLSPVSKLLEYQAQGTVSDPKWSPKILNAPRRLFDGMVENLKEATKPAATERSRPRLRLPVIGELLKPKGSRTTEAVPSEE